MHPEPFPLEAYLARIGLSLLPAADLNGLHELMRAQLFNVPFENLDVQAGLEISLDAADIISKIIDRKRGGYCYEVNGLFAMALQALGFSFEILGARPMFYPSRRPKTHMVIAVTIEGNRYLCDTGFGSYGLRTPLAMEVNEEGVQQDWDRFRLQTLNAREQVLQAWIDGAWHNQYCFDDYVMEILDFGPANYFNSHSPDAIFVQKTLVVQHKPDARYLLVGNQLKTITANNVSIEELSAMQKSALIKQLFGLNVE